MFGIMKSNAKNDAGAADRFICPITMRPANGRTPFVFVKGCGHVVSEQSLKQVGGNICVVCSKPYEKDDVVPLYPPKEVVAQRRAALEQARAQDKAAREAAKAGGEEGRAEKRAAGVEEKESKTSKKARLEALLAGGAGSKVGATNASLKTAASHSALVGSTAHMSKAKDDPIYASMFQKADGTKAKDSYDAAWVLVHKSVHATHTHTHERIHPKLACAHITYPHET